MKKILLSAAVLAITFVACDKDETTPVTNTTSGTATTGTTTSTTGTTTSTTGSTATKSSYTFSDDGIECTPFSSNPSINAQGILSVVSNPCQDSGGKLDGYFKYNNRPSTGTYTIVGTAGTFPNSFSLSDSEYSFLFYNHAGTTWYATSGTVTLTASSGDSTKLDMNWKDVTMTSADGSKTVKFSGTLLAL